MVWHHSLPLMNSFNKTEAAVFSCRLCFLRAFPFISSVGIHLIFEQRLRVERSQTYHFMLSTTQGSSWYHFYNIFGMTQSGIEPTTSGSRGERFTTEPPLQLSPNILISNVLQNKIGRCPRDGRDAAAVCTISHAQAQRLGQGQEVLL